MIKETFITFIANFCASRYRMSQFEDFIPDGMDLDLSNEEVTPRSPIRPPPPVGAPPPKKGRKRKRKQKGRGKDYNC